MSIQEFLNQLRGLASFSEEELALLGNQFRYREIERKTNLLSQGQVAQEVYFILEGCLRLYYEKEGEDISAYFFTENMFAGAYDSFVSRKPSRHFIEAIEDCKVLYIAWQPLQDLFQAVPKMNELVRKVMEERFVSLHQLFTSHILDSPEERYIHFMEQRPDLIQRVPQHQVATFLGITPVSLSRIRSRLSKNNKK